MFNVFSWGVLIFLIVLNLIISPHFSPTWDFPHHLLAGLVRVHEVEIDNYQHMPYGVFTQVAPLVFSRFFPSSWFPTSYLLFSVVLGSLAVIFYYLLVRQTFGIKIALPAAITVFLLPRFTGHLHTNVKDIPMASFFIICIYFLNRFFKRNKLVDLVVSILLFAFAVNTKVAAIYLLPLIFVWVFFFYYFVSKREGRCQRSAPFYLLVLLIFLVVPLAMWFLLWPGPWLSFFSGLDYVMRALSRFPPRSSLYAIEQLLVTTPLLLLIFVPFGVYALYKKVRDINHSVSFFFLILLFYSLLKYPLLSFPIIDDIRYFIEIYFALSLIVVLGVRFLFKNYANWVFLLIFVYLSFLQLNSHPYQINYFNILGEGQDADFWAASYREVFAYVNNIAPKEATVSARLAPELAFYYIRPDLQRNLNSVPPDKSDIVVILNRASLYDMYQVTDFVASYKPTKVFTDRYGKPLSLVYLTL